MAISFASGSWALANWGFGAGDIAVIAGAGRTVGTWLFAQVRDRNLLSFLSVDAEDAISRKGLLDVVALHRRWDTQITLLKNGKPYMLRLSGENGPPVVENMDKFTWFMTLVTAALDASLSSVGTRIVCTTLLGKLLESSDSGAEYLARELKQHVEGWMSAACVRNISKKARASWQEAARMGLHYPGSIPDTDYPDLIRFVLWLAQGSTKEYVTASSDTFCFAKILEQLGLEICTTQSPTSIYDESQIVVRFSLSAIGGSNLLVRRRRGMRVPLAHMEEVMSLWPAPIETTNTLRHIFVNGTRAASDVRLRLVSFHDLERARSLHVELSGGYKKDGEGLLYRPELASPQEESYHPEHCISDLMNGLFPVSSRRLWKALSKLVQPWDVNARNHLIEALETWERPFTVDGDLTGPYLDMVDKYAQHPRNHLQVFVLGYYYALLSPLINTSYLTVQEVYGSWGWEDTNVLYFFHNFINTATSRRMKGDKVFVKLFHRHELLRAAAYLFAGADEALKDPLSPETTIGIIGKLSLLDSCMLGCPRSMDEIGHLVLLDTDSSIIPSNAMGIVSAGTMPPVRALRTFSRVPLKDIEAELHTEQDDFTSHIEPDWENDAGACMVVYRYGGRLVYKTNVRYLETLLWDSINYRKKYRHELYTNSAPNPAQSSEQTSISAEPALSLGNLQMVDLDGFHGGQVLEPREEVKVNPREEAELLRSEAVFDSFIVPTYDRPKAFFCLLGMYKHYDRRSNSRFGSTIDIVASSKEAAFVQAQNRKASFVLLSSNFLETGYTAPNISL